MSGPKSVIYEHPLNERMRTFLRLEFLFRQVRHFMKAGTAWDSRAVISGLMEILAILGRADLKTELIKELERNTTTLRPLVDRPEVDNDQLATILHWLERLYGVLQERDGQLGQELREDEFLNAVRQRSTIPGGTCDFDLPIYHRWLSQPHEVRHHDQEAWLATLDPVRKSVELVLKLVRGSAEALPKTAEEGGYQDTLDPAVPFQLLRIALPAEVPYFAEISGGRHRFSVRFMVPTAGERPRQTKEAVEFRLTACAL